MTTSTELSSPVVTPVSADSADRRGSWMPTGAMITSRILELRKRRGLMIAMIVVNIGIPTIFLTIRLLAHAFDPKSYQPAGGYDIFTNLVAGLMFVFGFIVAAMLGCTAGSIDLSEGMFRHLVVTGRSRLSLYFARIPAGLAIVCSMVAIGFTIVCVVCVLAAPKTISYDGNNIPPGLSSTQFEAFAETHLNLALCDLSYNGPLNINVPCKYDRKTGVGVIGFPKNAPSNIKVPSKKTLEADAVIIAKQNYRSYAEIFLSPPVGLMIKSGLWLELETAIGFLVGLGLGSLIGQRTISVILMVVLEVILTPLLSKPIHLIVNLQRGIVGIAMSHLEPGGLPVLFSGGGNGPPGSARSLLVPESTTVAICVVVGWIVVWTALGAWRMATRDA